MTYENLDSKLINELLEDGRASFRTLSERVGVSVATISRHLSGLEERGVITGYAPTIKYEKLGYGLTAIIQLKVEGAQIPDITTKLSKYEQMISSIDSWIGKFVEKIDLYDLDLEMARVQSILSQRFEDPDFTVEEELLKSLALNSLIADTLILNFLKENKIEVLDLSAYKLLSKNEIFQDQGEFSLEKVNSFARQNGFLPGKYIESIREDIAVNYWRAGLGVSSFITNEELDQNINLTNQTRDVTFTKINQADIEKSIELVDQEVLTFFEENPSYFISKEKAKISFIEISLKDLEEKQLIDGAYIQKKKI